MFIQTPSPALRINGTLSKGNYPNKIILHHPMFYGTPQELNEMEIENPADPMIMSGYNYYVRKDGSTYAMRPTWAIGANCYKQNTQSISVCAEGNFDVDIMPAIQKNAIIILIKWLKETNNIIEVAPHSKYFNTDCPGFNYPLEDILNEKIEKIEEAEEMNDFTADQKAKQKLFKVPEDNNVVPTGLNITPLMGYGWIETTKDGRILNHISRCTYYGLSSDGTMTLTHLGQTRNI